MRNIGDRPGHQLAVPTNCIIFGSYVLVLPAYSGNFKFLLRYLMGMKTSYSLITELKLFGINEDVLDLRGWFFFDGNAS